jgi:hypothetical protein
MAPSGSHGTWVLVLVRADRHNSCHFTVLAAVKLVVLPLASCDSLEFTTS